MFKRNDYIIISLICFILGFAAVSQYYAGKNVDKLTQPETNEVMALEIGKVAKNNASLKLQVSELTNDYEDYKNSPENSSQSRSKIFEEISTLDSITGVSSVSGQGITLMVSSEMTTANIVDLVDALKNIGAQAVSINGKRIMLNTYLAGSEYSAPIRVVALGNSNVLESALTRKGGIIEQISSKNVKINLEKSDKLLIPAGNTVQFHYGKIIK